jgi:hypothetical protein
MFIGGERWRWKVEDRALIEQIHTHADSDTLSSRGSGLDRITENLPKKRVWLTGVFELICSSGFVPQVFSLSSHSCPPAPPLSYLP